MSGKLDCCGFVGCLVLLLSACAGDPDASSEIEQPLELRPVIVERLPDSEVDWRVIDADPENRAIWESYAIGREAVVLDMEAVGGPGRQRQLERVSFAVCPQHELAVRGLDLIEPPFGKLARGLTIRSRLVRIGGASAKGIRALVQCPLHGSFQVLPAPMAAQTHQPGIVHVIYALGETTID